mmetsp:Transcript_28254/g.67322  ORF Transcript_28254/g.67322 Transcript_28254/m.67322 type:complete len:131 (+) Transcript_28254:414-806(+)
MAPVCTCNTYLVVRNVDAHDSAKPPQTTIPIEMLRQLQGRYQTFGKHTDNQIVIIAAPLGVLHGYDMNADGCQRLARLAAWRGVVCRISVKRVHYSPRRSGDRTSTLWSLKSLWRTRHLQDNERQVGYSL